LGGVGELVEAAKKQAATTKQRTSNLFMIFLLLIYFLPMGLRMIAQRLWHVNTNNKKWLIKAIIYALLPLLNKLTCQPLSENF